MNDEAARALRWISDLLEDRAVPYQVVGGVAARAHGAQRPIVDVDLYVPTSALMEIAESVAEHVTWGPGHVRQGGWDIVFLKLEVEGQTVELGGADQVRIYDSTAGRWHDERIDFGTSERREVLGIVVPVMPRDRLVEYKRRLDREVDRQDLRELGEDRQGPAEGSSQT